ncbi:MAG: hypothetical protein K6E84_00425 [Lachnospiraceae bacterium]|nr:hypothetical protein [Lachnospiraceae bacterium]
MISHGEKQLIGRMQQAWSDMKRPDELYRGFRRIRHDFANYIQSSSFESEDEGFILRLRVLKKNTLDLTNELLEEVNEYIATEPLKTYDYLTEELPEMGARDVRGQVLRRLWLSMREYFAVQLTELSRVKEILEHLQDRLERSLPPDEEESRIHLEECDSITCHMTADDPLLAAYVYTLNRRCSEAGGMFRFQMGIPVCFQQDVADLYYILGRISEVIEVFLQELALQEEVKGRGGEDAQQSSPVLIRLRLAGNMGLWHLFLEMGPAREGDPAYLARDKALKKILRRMDASFRQMREEDKIRIDITG